MASITESSRSVWSSFYGKTEYIWILAEILMGETEGLIWLFCSLECFNCWLVGGVSVEQKVLFGVCCNRILCVPGFIQEKETQGQSKISSFWFWFESRDWGGRLSSRFSCVAPGMERYSLDLPRAVKNREHAFEVRCGYARNVNAWNM